MTVFFNVSFLFVCLVTLVRVLEPWVVRRVSARREATEAELAEMTLWVSQMPAWRVSAIKTAGKLSAALVMIVLCIGLGFPLFLESAVFYQHWPDFVVQLPANGIGFLIGLIPAILMAGLSADYLVTKLAQLIAQVFVPGRASLLVRFMKTDGDFGQQSMPFFLRAVRRDWIFALGLYACSIALIYSSSEVLTETHFHQRSIFAWNNQTIPHEQLLYLLDEPSGQLEIRAKGSDEIIESVDLLADSEATMHRTLESIRQRTTATLVQQGSSTRQ